MNHLDSSMCVHTSLLIWTGKQSPSAIQVHVHSSQSRIYYKSRQSRSAALCLSLQIHSFGSKKALSQGNALTSSSELSPTMYRPRRRSLGHQDPYEQPQYYGHSRIPYRDSGYALHERDFGPQARPYHIPSHSYSSRYHPRDD